MGLPTRMRPIRSGCPWHYREGAWPGFERTLTVSNWARGRGIPKTTLAPYRTEQDRYENLRQEQKMDWISEGGREKAQEGKREL